MHRDKHGLSVSIMLAVSIVAGLIASSAHCKSIGQNNLAITDKVESPDGRLELVNECTKEAKDSDTHPCSIFLRDLGSVAKKPLYEWDRDISWNGGIDVFWSPASKAVILNNYLYTDSGESILFIFEPRFERVNLSQIILGAHPPKLHEDDDHAYPAATWIDANTIRLKLTGHHDSPPTGGFTYTYIYNVAERSSRLTKHVEECDRAHDQC